MASTPRRSIRGPPTARDTAGRREALVVVAGAHHGRRPLRRDDHRRSGAVGPGHLGEHPHGGDPEILQGVHLQRHVAVGVPAAFLGDHGGVEPGRGAEPGGVSGDQFLARLVDRLGREHHSGEDEVAAVAGPQRLDHRMVLVEVGGVLQPGMAELPAHHRAVVEVAGVESVGSEAPKPRP